MTVVLFGETPILGEPEGYVVDYTADFEILKNLTTSDIVERIKYFLPHWITNNTDTVLEKLLYSITDQEELRDLGTVSDYSGIRWLYEQLKTFIKSAFITSAEGDDLNKLALDLIKLNKRQYEGDWYFIYRIIEILYFMTVKRDNYERLILKHLGNYTINKTGADTSLDSTRYRLTLPSTYHYTVTDSIVGNIKVYKNNRLLIKNYDYYEVGRLTRFSNCIDLVDLPLSDDEIKIKPNINPLKEYTFLGSEVETIKRNRINIGKQYKIRTNNEFNILVFKNNEMLRPNHDYNEVGEENTLSYYLDIWGDILPTDTLDFRILGYSATDGYHMINTNHHLLEQNQYGFYCGSEYVCTSDDDIERGELVNFDDSELTCQYANATSGGKVANGIVSNIGYVGDTKKYFIKYSGIMKYNDLDSLNNPYWNFTPGATLYLDTTDGQITEISPVPPDSIQIIGTAITSNKILLDSSLNTGDVHNYAHYNSPRGKFNNPATVYIIVKNAETHGAIYDGSTYTGVTKGSNLYYLMKEVYYSKCVGVHVHFELHKNSLNYTF